MHGRNKCPYGTEQLSYIEWVQTMAIQSMVILVYSSPNYPVKSINKCGLVATEHQWTVPELPGRVEPAESSLGLNGSRRQAIEAHAVSAPLGAQGPAQQARH